MPRVDRKFSSSGKKAAVAFMKQTMTEENIIRAVAMFDEAEDKRAATLAAAATIADIPGLNSTVASTTIGLLLATGVCACVCVCVCGVSC